MTSAFESERKVNVYPNFCRCRRLISDVSCMARTGLRILTRSSCGLKKSDGSAQSEIRLRKIARQRKLREEFVAEQPADGDAKADSDRLVPVEFHVDLAAANRKIQS